jgi:signal transduction histidine kinase
MPAVTVADQGPGLTPADMEGLFQKYSRLSARPTGGESSTGLGLAIVKMLAERMSGTINGENRPDGPGALFTLCLPPA